MLHNKANSSSWAHFGHDSHTNQKEKIFLTLQIPLGSGRRWHILHWVQVPSELLRSSLDGSTIQSYPESTSLGISAGWSWFVGMYIAPTSNILSSWDWLSSHFGDSQGPPTAEWGLKESTSFPSDKISWNRTRSPGGWKQCQRGRGPGFMTGPTAVVHSYLQDTDLSVDESCWSQRTSWRKKQSYDVFRSLRTKKNTVHTLTAAPLVKPGWPRMSSGSPCSRGMAVHGTGMCCGCCHEVQQRQLHSCNRDLAINYLLVILT